MSRAMVHAISQTLRSASARRWYGARGSDEEKLGGQQNRAMLFRPREICQARIGYAEQSRRGNSRGWRSNLQRG